jgi:hypothetical protein
LINIGATENIDDGEFFTITEVTNKEITINGTIANFHYGASSTISTS